MSERYQEAIRASKERHARGERPSLGRRIVLGLLLVALLLGGLALLGLIGWFLVSSAGIFLRALGAIMVVIVASLAWNKMRAG